MTQALTYETRSKETSSPIAKHLLQLMDTKKTNLALSADVTTAKELLLLADQIGPEIAVLKTHIDIIRDFTSELARQLKEIARQHQFLIFEDRKFADIGHTVREQYAGGIYCIADWADITNAHSLPGPGVVQGLASIGKPKGRGLLLIAEMSSAGHLMSKSYATETLKMAEQNADFVIGFITQHALSPDPQWINFTPGIQLKTGQDTLGQQYRTPEEAILKQGTDIIIVGRDIINAENPLEQARIYRKQGFLAYQKRIQ